MKTLVLYYTYSGHSKELAEKFAGEQQAELCAIRDKKRPGTLKAYTAGCFAAMRMQSWETAVIDANMAAFDRIVFFAPVWASHPAPQVTGVMQELPPDKDVEMYMVSASGKSAAKEKVRELVERKLCRLSFYKNVTAK